MQKVEPLNKVKQVIKKPDKVVEVIGNRLARMKQRSDKMASLF